MKTFSNLDIKNDRGRLVHNRLQHVSHGPSGGMPNLRFTYDASGNRASKWIQSGSDSSTWVKTYYVRDASDNIMSTYERKVEQSNGKDSIYYALVDQPIYGSSRIGLYTAAGQRTSSLVGVPNFLPESLPIGAAPQTYKRVLGYKAYELSNHLGNVLATLSDRKVGVDSLDSLQRPIADGISDYYTAEVLSAQDYYGFGSTMPGRNYNSGDYKFGFNGKENDNEVQGNGNQQDYGFRIYDPRLGKFLSVDPLTKGYPMLTPYQFSSNTPISAVDLDGLEAKIMIFQENNNGEYSQIAIFRDESLIKQNIQGVIFIHKNNTLTSYSQVAENDFSTQVYRAGKQALDGKFTTGGFQFMSKDASSEGIEGRRGNGKNEIINVEGLLNVMNASVSSAGSNPLGKSDIGLKLVLKTAKKLVESNEIGNSIGNEFEIKTPVQEINPNRKNDSVIIPFADEYNQNNTVKKLVYKNVSKSTGHQGSTKTKKDYKNQQNEK